jgi:rsbT co-antagonist protein RsbR
LSNEETTRDEFYSLEKKVNDLMDQFLTNFFISYSRYKDELLDKQRKLVENLSVPIIPINKEICILPLIGMIDYLRINTIKDKVLDEIEAQHIQVLIIDLSGVTPMDHEITSHLLSIIEGISMMGCRTIITGLRSEIVKGILKSGNSFRGYAEFKGTLQIALNDELMDQEA